MKSLTITEDKPLSKCSLEELQGLAYTYTGISLLVLFKYRKHELIEFLKDRSITRTFFRRRKP